MGRKEIIKAIERKEKDKLLNIHTKSIGEVHEDMIVDFEDLDLAHINKLSELCEKIKKEKKLNIITEQL